MKLYPEKLRTRIMLLAITLVCVATFTIAYLVEKQGSDLLLQEKEQKLFAVAHTLDIALGDAFVNIDPKLSRDEQITSLNKMLSPKVEELLKYTPKIGTGYYNLELDAIIVYAPEKKYQDRVGITITPDHPGRIVMATGKSQVFTGPQVRGDIVNAMIPIVREGKILGYIWSNELVKDINAQTLALDINIITVCIIGLVCSIFLTMLLSKKFNRDIEIIKQGLSILKCNLQTKLPKLKGEMNEIVEGVNQLSSALNEAKSTNEMILDCIKDGVITVDNNGIITTFNPAAERIIGYTKQDVIGHSYISILDNKDYKSAILDTLYNGIDHIGLETDLPVSGKMIPISSSSSHLKDPQGIITGAVVVFKDLSEQKKMQRVIQETERLIAVGELMAGVAHEIRNPLTAIRGFVQYLRRDLYTEDREEYIAIILQEVDSINKVIQQLLDFSKPYNNYYSTASLNKIIQDTLILIQTTKNSSSIDFKLQLDETLPLIYVDKNMIKQVLLNLLINSIQAIQDNGTITITTRVGPKGDTQEMEILDTGIGLKESDKHNIFTPFFTTKPTGTGLGLSIAHKIITSHKGTIEITNHKQGGVSVIVSLPMHKDV